MVSGVFVVPGAGSLSLLLGVLLPAVSRVPSSESEFMTFWGELGDTAALITALTGLFVFDKSIRNGGDADADGCVFCPLSAGLVLGDGLVAENKDSSISCVALMMLPTLGVMLPLAAGLMAGLMRGVPADLSPAALRALVLTPSTKLPLDAGLMAGLLLGVPADLLPPGLAMGACEAFDGLWSATLPAFGVVGVCTRIPGLVLAPGTGLWPAEGEALLCASLCNDTSRVWASFRGGLVAALVLRVRVDAAGLAAGFVTMVSAMVWRSLASDFSKERNLASDLSIAARSFSCCSGLRSLMLESLGPALGLGTDDGGDRATAGDAEEAAAAAAAAAVFCMCVGHVCALEM
jgi:hypothetical protein